MSSDRIFWHNRYFSSRVQSRKGMFLMFVEWKLIWNSRLLCIIYFYCAERESYFFFFSCFPKPCHYKDVLHSSKNSQNFRTGGTSWNISCESIYENSNVECPKSEPFNKHSGSKIDKSNGTKISGKNCLKFGYTLYARLSFSSDRNSGKMFHSGAVDGKALFYSPLKIFEYSSRESVVVRLSILGFRNSSFFM